MKFTCCDCDREFRKNSNHQKRCKLCAKDRTARYRQTEYGITTKEYNFLVRKQRNKCALCGRKERRRNYKTGKRQTLCLDHDHITGKNRALLCRDCNFALGLFDDNIFLVMKAVQYLRKHKE